jgi:hypothetical protein
MRKLDQTPQADPVTAWDRMFQKYPANTETGRRLRQSVAKTWLRDMAAVEAEIQEREAEQAVIADRIARMHAEHELNMQYLVHFGVTLSERETFRSLLDEVVRDGNLTIRDVAKRAHDASQRNGDSSVEGGVESATLPG